MYSSPYLIKSTKKACILTDSKPCVQAYEKLCRGEFSASPRVSTFLSVVIRYQLLSDTSPAELSSLQTLQAGMTLPVKTKLVSCAPSSLEPGTLLSEPSQFSSKATLAFPSPAGLPG